MLPKRGGQGQVRERDLVHEWHVEITDQQVDALGVVAQHIEDGLCVQMCFDAATLPFQQRDGFPPPCAQ